MSPSPYTANTERAKQFNVQFVTIIIIIIISSHLIQMYVRGVIEQRLDVLVPISHQPRELVSEIIADASSRFPEFSSCVRKRIRTFLKSYRRSRKVRDLHPSSSNGMASPHSQVSVLYHSSITTLNNNNNRSLPLFLLLLLL